MTDKIGEKVIAARLADEVDEELKKYTTATMGRDKKVYVLLEPELRQLLQSKPVQVDEDTQSSIEDIRMVIQKATSDYMPVYRRIILNDAVEVAIKQLLQSKVVTITTCEIHEFCHDAISECVDREDLIMVEAELAKWLESRKVTVEK